MRFSSVYGHIWTSQYPTLQALEVAKHEWGESLKRFNLADLKRGFEHCKAEKKLPPTLPEFIQLCQPDFGLPNKYEAYQEACKAAYPGQAHLWSHEAVYHAAKAVGLYALMCEPERTTRPQFEHAYEVICRRIKNGEVLEKPIPKALPEIMTPGQRNLEVGKQHIQAMREILQRVTEKLKQPQSEGKVT